MSEEEDFKIEPWSVGQAIAMHAQTTRALLADLSGEDGATRAASMGLYLFQLTTDLREPKKMAGVLRALADELETREPMPERQPGLKRDV